MLFFFIFLDKSRISFKAEIDKMLSIRPLHNLSPSSPPRFQDGCGPLLQSWLETNKVTWVPALACLAGLQILTLCTTIYVLKRKRKNHRGSRSSSTRQLHDYIE